MSVFVVPSTSTFVLLLQIPVKEEGKQTRDRELLHGYRGRNTHCASYSLDIAPRIAVYIASLKNYLLCRLEGFLTV